MYNHRSILLTGLALLAALSSPPLAAAGAPVTKTVTMEVAPQRAPCTGVGKRSCLSVKPDGEQEYSLFYAPIEGFDYKEGKRYTIQVVEEPVPNPPADGSSLRYRLVKVLSMIDETQPLEGTLWVLASVRTRVDTNPPSEPQTMTKAARVTLKLEDARIAGSDGCNRYMGSYRFEGERLHIEVGGATMMACPEPLMELERDYLAALRASTGAKVSGNGLELTDKAGQTLLSFHADRPPPLVGTEWRLQHYNNGKGGLLTSRATERMNARFGEDGKLTGFSGCNRYFAGYRVDDDGITIQPPAGTRRMCAEPEGVMKDEAGFLAALGRAASYQIADDRLTLLDQDGKRLANFRPAGD